MCQPSLILFSVSQQGVLEPKLLRIKVMVMMMILMMIKTVPTPHEIQPCCNLIRSHISKATYLTRYVLGHNLAHEFNFRPEFNFIMLIR